MRKAKKNPTKQTKTSRCNWQKKSLHLQQSFLYISLPLLLQRETSDLHVLWRKCAHKKFCCLCSCSLFFTAPHFYLTVGSQF